MIQDMVPTDALFNPNSITGIFVKIRYALANIQFDSPIVWVAIAAIVLGIILLMNSDFPIKMIGLCILLCVLVAFVLLVA